MTERITSNALIIIVTAIVVIFTVIMLIQQAEANIMFWILRPSESTALDIVSKFTALGGTSGKVTTDYRNITNNVNYYVYHEGKVVCVMSIKKGEGVLNPLKTINCFSAPFELDLEELNDEGKIKFLLCFSKDYDTMTQTLDIDTEWKDFTGGCV